MLSSVLLFLNIGSGEMVLILFAALMLFGGNKLPELARGLGKGIRDFKDASEDVKREINNQINNYEDKKTEKPVEKLNEPAETASTYEPVAGTLPAFEGHTATDVVAEEEHDSLKPGTNDATVEHSTELKHPITGQHETTAQTVTPDEPAKKAIEEEYK